MSKLNKGRMIRLIMLSVFIFSLLAFAAPTYAQADDPLAQFVPKEVGPNEWLRQDDLTIGFVLSKPFQRGQNVDFAIPNLDKYPANEEISCWMAIGKARFYVVKDKQYIVQTDGTKGNVVQFNGKREFHVLKRSYTPGNGIIICLFGMSFNDIENDILSSMARMATDSKGCGREGCLTVERYIGSPDDLFAHTFTLKREDAAKMIDEHKDFQPPQTINQCWDAAQVNDSTVFPIALPVAEGGATRVYLTGELVFRSGAKIGPGWTIILGTPPDGNTPADLNKTPRLQSLNQGQVCWWMTYVSDEATEKAAIKADPDHPSDTSNTVNIADLR
jgi:hypothetical protein